MPLLDRESLDPEIVLMDGYDDCFVGLVERAGQEPVACYSHALVIEKLIRDGLSRAEAIEFHEFNQAGAYVGPRTPCFLHAP
jgi:biotin synthase-related radical SAM superfamily protein